MNTQLSDMDGQFIKVMSQVGDGIANALRLKVKISVPIKLNDAVWLKVQGAVFNGINSHPIFEHFDDEQDKRSNVI